MEKQGPEYSRMVSKVKVGSKIEWTVTESSVKLESSSEISVSNKCLHWKGDARLYDIFQKIELIIDLMILSKYLSHFKG